jgi:hypothetical protein
VCNLGVVVMVILPLPRFTSAAGERIVSSLAAALHEVVSLSAIPMRSRDLAHALDHRRLGYASGRAQGVSTGLRPPLLSASPNEHHEAH